MRKLLKWVVVTVGIAALVRWLKRRGTESGIEQTTTDDPADELRRRLAETRETEEQAPGAPAATEGSVEERREDVHEQGRAALDEMKSPDEV